MENGALGKAVASSLIAFFAAVGCSAGEISSPAVSNRKLAIELGSSVRTMDDEYADFVTQVPGFGGMFFDASGNLNVFVTDPRKQISDAALETLLAKFGEGARAHAAVASKIVRQGQYDYRQLRNWFIGLNAIGDQAITYRDIDERLNRIVIGVAHADALEPIRSMIESGGIPDGAFEVIVKQPPAPNTTLQEYYRPIIGGFQIQSVEGTCTLGFNAFLQYWWGIDSSSAYFVTNSHCTGFSHMGVVTGLQMGQPIFTVGGEVMGTEVADPAFFTHAEDPVNCPVNASCRWSDAALFHGENVPGGFWHATVALPNPGLTLADSYGIAEVSTEPFSSPVAGTAVMKVGRTTGWSWGAVGVYGTCFTIVQGTTNKTLLCQSSAPYTAAGGDSGSPVMQERYSQYPNVHNGVKLVGIHWGHDNPPGELSYFSIFERVSTELGRFGMGADGLSVTRNN